MLFSFIFDRNFSEWFSQFRESIADYSYYTDFSKVYSNIASISKELSLINTLIGDKNIEESFETLLKTHPEVLKCFPILMAKRELQVFARDDDRDYKYHFDEFNYPIEQYKVFMRKTGLFDLLQNHIVNNITDYVLGIETGLDSHARKSRGGDLMENLVEDFLKKGGFVRDETYFKEMTIKRIERKWGLDLSSISNQGKMQKRFDFVVVGPNTGTIYGIETNFYASNGSKLNETARSYKTIAMEAKDIQGFKFVWITDGKGWENAKNNLQETFDVLDNMFCIAELEKGVVREALD